MNGKNYLIVTLFAALALSGCATKVERVDIDKKIDLSGEWNDYDAMLVSKELIASALGGKWLDKFLMEKGREPALIVGHIANRSTEHINSGVFIKHLEKELMNSGKVIFVASPTEREGIRDERDDMQQGYTDPATIKAIGKEKGADYMFIGSINAIKDSENRKSVVLYQVNMELIDLETNVKTWIGQKEIKKMITKPRVTF